MTLSRFAMKMSKWGKKKCKMYNLRQKETRNFNIRAQVSADKSGGDANKGGGDLGVRPHPANPALYKMS